MILGNLPWRNFGTYHARVMALTSLVVCAEDEAGDMLSRVLQDLDIEVQISSHARAAMASARARRFDALVVDGQEEAAGLSLIAQLRGVAGNSNAIAIALVGSHAKARGLLPRRQLSH
jgi:DNA-binding response OmpR family regulator